MIRTSGDFVDERDRVGNQTRRFKFRKEEWGPIHKYMNGRIKEIGSKVSLEMEGGIGESYEHLGHEAGSQMSSLRDVQGDIVSGVGNMAQDLERKLTDNAERNNKREQLMASTYAA